MSNLYLFLLFTVFFSLSCFDHTNPFDNIDPVPDTFAGNDTTIYFKDKVMLDGKIKNDIKPEKVTWYKILDDKSLEVLANSSTISFSMSKTPGIFTFVFKAYNNVNMFTCDTVVVTVTKDSKYAVSIGKYITVFTDTTFTIHATKTGIFPVTKWYWKIGQDTNYTTGTSDYKIKIGSKPDTIRCVVKGINEKGVATRDTIYIFVKKKTINYIVNLTGKIIRKNSKPIKNIEVKLEKYEISDKTDSKGVFNLIKIGNRNTMIASTDTLVLLNNSKFIDFIILTDLTNTLGDIVLGNRSVVAKIDSTMTKFKKIEAVYFNVDDMTTVAGSIGLKYNSTSHKSSNTVMFRYPSKKMIYSLYVNVYNNDSLLTGRSDTILFNSNDTSLQVPLIDPFNAVPVATVLSKLIVGLSDSIFLKGSATDNFGGTIEKWEWDAGNTGKFKEVSDTNFSTIAPSETDSSYECVLKITDNDGNKAFDTVSIIVCNLPPLVNAGNDTTVDLKSVITLKGKAEDINGYIVKWEWKKGSAEWIQTLSNETMLIAPLTPQIVICSLRVTDDDGEIGVDAIKITVKDLLRKTIKILSGNNAYPVEVKKE